MYFWIHHTGTIKESYWLLDLGVISLVPAGTRHRALTVPATDAAVPGRPSPLPPRFWNTPGRPREKLVIPSVLAPAQKRWNHRPRRVWRRAVAWVRPPVERRPPSAPRRGAAMVRRYHPSQSVVTTSGRSHRHHLHPRDLGRSPGIPPFSYSSVQE